MGLRTRTTVLRAANNAFVTAPSFTLDREQSSSRKQVHKIAMANLDDELALFESEISSLVDDTSSAASGNTASFPNGSTISAPPTSAAQPTFAAPLLPAGATIGGVPIVSPFIASTLAARPMLGGVLPPPIPPPVFVPLQMRPMMASSSRPAAATIEGAPALYERPAAPIPAIPLQTMALPADIEAMAFKRQTDPLKKRLKDKVKKKFIRSGGGQVWEDSSLAEWDENDFRVFCGDLGNEVSDELLAKAFRKYPSFQKAKVVRDSRSNKSKGYGFVSFRESDDYVRAMREMDGKYVGNRPIKLRKSNWRERNLDTIKKKQKQKKDLGLF
ncbi:unnamed protein product [Caenorhabditis auriculariae]|uniref:RNA-binding protein 42 n=1 Tax=Caenorhabditis auriculariae TaxID=2777116 RepID=A0A8S1GZW7_9PELO|nr:unnamed protein product [Caenorhabditis auriculariae]